MANPLMSMLSQKMGAGNNSSINLVAQLMSGKLDGEQLVRNLIAQDPKNEQIWEQAKQMVNQGGDPQKIVMDKVQQMGINPMDFIKNLK